MIDRKKLSPTKYPVVFWHCAVEPADVRAVEPAIKKFGDCFAIRQAFERELLALMRECEERGRRKEKRAKATR